MMPQGETPTYLIYRAIPSAIYKFRAAEIAFRDLRSHRGRTSRNRRMHVSDRNMGFSVLPGDVNFRRAVTSA